MLHVCAQYRLFGTGEARVRFTLEDDWGHACACCESESGDGSMTVERPRLWWTHDQGQPYCYMLRRNCWMRRGACWIAVSAG